MTRKSRREIGRSVDELGGRDESVTYVEVARYFERVAEDPENVPLPHEQFSEQVVEEFGRNASIPFDELPGKLTTADFTPVERFALAYFSGEIKRRILKMRWSRGEGT